MPSASEHRDKYDLNRAFLNTGLAASQPEWAAIVAFYAAVHLIERLAAAERRGPIHHRTHGQRLDYIRLHRQHRALLHDYKELQRAAEISRYGTVNQFTSRYTAATVQSVLIDTHLVAIEDYVSAYFAPPPAAPGASPPAATDS